MRLRQLFVMLLARKWLIATTVLATLAAAAALSLLLPPRYTANASIVVDFRALDPVSGNVQPVALLPGYIATQLDIIASPGVALKAVDRLQLTEDPAWQEAFQNAQQGRGSMREWLALSLVRKVKVEPSRESSVVTIRYSDSDAQQAAAVVNAIVQAYIDTNVGLRVEPARETATFFDGQLQVLKRNLQAAQRKLSAFQRARGITTSDERYDVENARLAELSAQLVSAQAQGYEATSRSSRLDQSIAAGGRPDVLPEVVNNPLVQTLKRSVVDAQARAAELARRVGANHPRYRAARTEVEDAQRRLAQEMNVVAGSVRTSSGVATDRTAALRSELAAQRARVLSIKKDRDEAELLAREVDNAQRAYDTATARFTQTRLESESSQTNVSVLHSAAVPVHPSFPNMPLNLAFAAVVGMTLAIGLALIAEMHDRVVRSEDDVLQVLDVPVLGRVMPGSARIELRTAGLLPGPHGPGPMRTG